jgi:hypothetical protein
MAINSKQKLGQFYTTNYEYILQNLYIPENITKIIEPFTGNGDLLNFIKDKDKYDIECYDIEPKKDFIIEQDTILNPPNISNSFILTNPPYLARNKSMDKELFDKYKTNDLYKCFIEILITNDCLGGILIVPLNFICSIRKNDIDLRKKFMFKYNIIILNIFEEQVFEDTSYTICSFQFELKEIRELREIKEIKSYIYPSNKEFNIKLDNSNNYTIGGDIYNLKQNSLFKIDRATRLYDNKDNFTNILVKCLDDNINNKIGLKIVDDIIRDKYIDTTPKLSGRSYAILVIKPKLTIIQQEKLVEIFNKFLNEKRDNYNSLFLSNYRESNNMARKRISFTLVYEICNYLLNDLRIIYECP